MRWTLALAATTLLLGCSPEESTTGSDLGPPPESPAETISALAPEPEPTPPPTPAPNFAPTAYTYCKHFTEKRLKAPASAQWPAFSAIAKDVENLGDGRFKVLAHVDSQNSFGAMLRSKVNCTVRKDHTAEDQWFLEQLWLKDKLVFIEDIDWGPEGAFKRCKKFTTEMWLDSSRDAKWPQPLDQARVDEFLEKTYRVGTFYENGAESGDVECILRETGENWFLDVLKVNDQMVFLREGLEPDEYDEAIADWEFGL